ncbi:MAG: hypothetical protein GY839_13285 [candidate division Zixibacteria bacterium]|nr:hypothetical protein [candidate division Zixibacteria bacterium]
MGNRMLKILVLAPVLILFGSVISYGQLLGTACEPYGSISISGEPAADNLPVIAYIGGQELARCLTLGGQYSLFIPMDDPDTSEKDGWADGDKIEINVNGTAANPSFFAQQGRIRQDIVLTALSVKLDTWGKIKALFK